MAAEYFLKNLKKGLQNGGSCGILIKLTCAAEMNIRVWRSLVSRLNGVQEALSSNLNTRTILTKRYRCVWRKVRRINRFRAFSGPDFFFQTIDANRCFRASAPIRTGRFPFSGRCVQPVPFLNGVFPAGSCIFLKKESQRFGRRFVGPDGLRKRRLFSFQKGRWSQRLYLKAGAIMLRPYFLCTGGVT